ncbi:hypothetical protein LWI29_002683 [Acer saccharum]|uniref:Uncharacterized protein n=1 Tax=Acer saccharum TaxID=4024 RepID=A0AA39SQE1_ACESA|nr:hypothetical protein LWI29_002683 [Acer saccharum]
MYTAKSGYHVGCSLRSISDSSHSSTFSVLLSSWWKSLWKLHLPSKIKFFVWKACLNMHPSNEILSLRKVPVSRICPLCNSKNESVLHSLWGCSKWKQVRYFWLPKLMGNHKDKCHFFEFILDCFVRLTKEDLGLLCVCFWKIWSLRNAAVHDSSPDLDVDVVDWSRCFVSEFFSVQAARAGVSHVVPFRNPIWIPPDPGLYKINCDAALNTASCLVGVGIVIRNSVGLVMASSSQRISASFSPQVAEAVAIQRGLQFALDSGLTPCRIDSDAEIVVAWINRAVPLCSDIGIVLMDIQNLLQLNFCLSVNFVPRKANRVAHVLAKNGLSCVEDMFWLEDSPPSIGSLISAECRACL